MPLSNNARARGRQLANLKRGGAVSPGRPATHGAYARIAEAELDEKTRQIFDALVESAPVRAPDGGLPSSDTLIVRMLAEVLIRRERVRVTELKLGLETPDGRIRGVVEYGLRLDAQALELAKEMGMTPASRAKLGLDLARTHRTLEDEIADSAGAWDAIDGTEAPS